MQLRFVGEAVAKLFADPAELARLAREAEIDAGQVAGLLEPGAIWRSSPMDVVHRVELGAEEITVVLDLSSAFGSQVPLVFYRVPARIRRRGVERRIVLSSGAGDASDLGIDPALVQAVARGHRWFEQLASGRARSIAEIARSEGVSPRYVARLLPLGLLAPDLVAEVLAGRQPVDLTAEVLTKRIDLPLSWAEQRVLLGSNGGRGDVQTLSGA